MAIKYVMLYWNTKENNVVTTNADDAETEVDFDLPEGYDYIQDPRGASCIDLMGPVMESCNAIREIIAINKNDNDLQVISFTHQEVWNEMRIMMMQKAVDPAEVMFCSIDDVKGDKMVLKVIEPKGDSFQFEWNEYPEGFNLMEIQLARIFKLTPKKISEEELKKKLDEL
jgi:hypothetical protein